ncbi:MAG TPA: SDR family oxidoreductase [Candidatus Hydrogenedentes bacterium]|nr:SDR family oxidoreductase [Candidatus Hydrogenedentota bacterium]
MGRNPLDSANKTAVILGAASTVARSIAMEFARGGYALVLADCDHEETARIAADVALRFDVACHAVPFDATAYCTHRPFLEECRRILGVEPQGVVLCFGYMPEQREAQEDFAKAQRAIDTNLTGAISVLELFASAFEARRGGFIVGLSSVAGDRGRKANYIYGAAKAGLTCFLSGLRNRLHTAGVHVLTVKPGFMDTKMTYGMPLPGPLVASPGQAARAIVRALRKGKDEVYVRFFWRYIMLIIRNIPEWQFKKMNI